MIFNEFSRKQKLFIFLFGVFLTNAIVAEIIGVKIVSIERTLGFSPLHWATPWGDFWDLNQTAGALNWPLVFITSDIINDYLVRKVFGLFPLLLPYLSLFPSLLFTRLHY